MTKRNVAAVAASSSKVHRRLRAFFLFLFAIRGGESGGLEKKAESYEGKGKVEDGC